MYAPKKSYRHDIYSSFDQEQHYGQHRNSTIENEPERFGDYRNEHSDVYSSSGQASNYKKKKKKRFLWTHKVAMIFYFACICGCVYQMVEVFLLYFMFKTVTDLRIYRPVNIHPPSLSICFPYLQLINFTRAFSHFPEIEDYARYLEADLNQTIDFDSHQMMVFKIEPDGFDWRMSKFMQEKYSLGQIMSMTKSLEDLFMRCVLTDPVEHTIIESDDLEDCRKVWDFSDYVKDESKCFLVNFRDIENFTSIYNLERLSAKFAWRSLLMQVRLNVDAIGRNMERLFIYLHPHYKLPTGRTDPSLEFKHPARNVTFIMTYSRVFNRLLPHPYDSDCQNYPVNRGHSVDQCIISSSLGKYGRVPFTIVAAKNSSLKVFGYRAIKDNRTLERDLEALIHQCMLKYERPDCMLEVFRSEMLSTYEGGSNLKIEVSIPSALDVVNKLDKKQTFLEYIIYNGSVLGFWFGICVTKILSLLVNWKKVILGRKGSKIGQNGPQITPTKAIDSKV